MLDTGSSAIPLFVDKMTDWKKIAGSIDPPIPAAEADRIVPVLEALEAVFRPQTLTIPQGAGVWACDIPAVGSQYDPGRDPRRHPGGDDMCTLTE